MPTVRSDGLVVLVVLAIVAGGCTSALPSFDDGTATPTTGAPTAADDPATGNGTVTGRSDASGATDGPSTESATANDSTTNGTANDSPTNSGPNTLVVERRATRVTGPERTNGSREYLTLQLDSGPTIRRSPLDLSGYTVQYGDGPTATIPRGVTLGPVPGGGVYLWTGPGDDRTLGTGDDGRYSQYVLHAGYDAPLIAENGTTVTVRNRSGAVVARQAVTPTNGSEPFVLRRPMESIDSLADAKQATPFALRAPTDVPVEYRFDQLRITPAERTYTLFYTRKSNDSTGEFSVGAIAPQATNRSDRPRDARSVRVGDQQGYYTTRELGNGARGYLWFVGPDGWGHFVNGPPNETQVVRIAESVSIVENRTR